MPLDELTCQSMSEGLKCLWAASLIEHHETIDSTNKRAKELAISGAPHGLLIIADEQTAGKGRLGRTWVSKRGLGIFMTLLLRPSMPNELITQLTMVTAIAAARALNLATGLDAKIKWPNDIVANGRKLCGILLERSFDCDGKAFVVCGTGFNVHQTMDDFPSELSQSASSVDLLTGKVQRRVEIVQHYLEQFELLYNSCHAGNADAIIKEYKKLSATLNQDIMVISGSDRYPAHAIGLDEDGSLQIKMADGTVKTVHAGDVSVRGVMGYV